MKEPSTSGGTAAIRRVIMRARFDRPLSVHRGGSAASRLLPKVMAAGFCFIPHVSNTSPNDEMNADADVPVSGKADDARKIGRMTTK